MLYGCGYLSVTPVAIPRCHPTVMKKKIYADFTGTQELHPYLYRYLDVMPVLRGKHIPVYT